LGAYIKFHAGRQSTCHSPLTSSICTALRHVLLWPLIGHILLKVLIPLKHLLFDMALTDDKWLEILALMKETADMEVRGNRFEPSFRL
jgi:hypothetical protein